MKEAKMIPFHANCEEPHCLSKALHVVGNELKLLCFKHSWTYRHLEDLRKEMTNYDHQAIS